VEKARTTNVVDGEEMFSATRNSSYIQCCPASSAGILTSQCYAYMRAFTDGGTWEVNI
jgi:hypothetical protein